MKDNINAKIFWLSVILGIIIRFVLMTLGHNFDFESYCIVGELAAAGKNVYANTARYNYGPIFFTILGIFWKIADNVQVFRIFIVTLLTLADLSIALLIRRRAGGLWAALFFLNPVSLIITGYHNQFDNIALALGAWALVCCEDSLSQKKFTFKDSAAIILLSLSLITKHILCFFPLWLIFNKRINTLKKFIYSFIPPILFLASFIPYWSEGSAGIIRNVFLYKSFNNFPLIGLSIINFFSITIPFQSRICLPVFGMLMLAGAYFFRREEIYDLFMLYTIALVCFSSAIANQYLAIPCMAVIILMRWKSLIYFIIGFLFLSCNGNGLHILSYIHSLGIQQNFLMKLPGSGGMYSLFAWCLLFYLLSYSHSHRT